MNECINLERKTTISIQNVQFTQIKRRTAAAFSNKSAATFHVLQRASSKLRVACSRSTSILNVSISSLRLSLKNSQSNSSSSAYVRRTSIARTAANRS